MIETLADYPALQAIQRALWHVSDVRGAAVMVGSGFSRNAVLASPSSKAPPLWGDIVAAMEQQLGSGSSGAENPLRLAEEFRALLGQAALDGLIRDLVPEAEWLPGNAHRRLLELPWSDVLTTNWDTLLERAKADLTDRSYDVVLTPKDIARTRSPRIVKLHGSLPSHTPFVFTEEDFRTYPNRFAPFVNLAQHVLLENELLLIGFSGDDPNFLAWAGWVRDQLGMSARRIRLAGILNLTTARRRYLENLNVTPIDLAPLVENISDPENRHAVATQLLIDSLHAAKPRPIHSWSRSKPPAETEWSAKSPQTRIADLLADWAADRECAPEWLIAPFAERCLVRVETEDVGQKAARDLDKIDEHQRGRFATELAWRLDMSHFGVPEWAKAPLEFVLEASSASFSNAERVRILVLLCYAAIEDRDEAAFRRYVAQLDATRGSDAEPAPWAAYLRGLFARDSLDLPGVAAAIPAIVGNDPVWLLRRAALQCVVCEYKTAAQLVRDAVQEIARRRALDRRSLWLLSREAWARFLWRAAAFELRDGTDGATEIGTDWPTTYHEHRTHPWDELNALDAELRQEQERERKYSAEEKIHFEAGSWTSPTGAGRFVASWVVPVEWQTRRLADVVGLPARIGSAKVMEDWFARSVSAHVDVADATQVWRVASYLHSAEGILIDDWFGRIRVAAMPLALVQDLVASLRSSIDFIAESLRNRDEGWTKRIECARSLMELLSRLSVRADDALAGEILALAVSVFERGGEKHWWLYAPTSHLLTRALSAIPPSKRGVHVGRMIAFPLPAERMEGLEPDWPEFSDSFQPREVTIDRPAGAWDRRISELIDWVTKDREDTRHWAILRLWTLSKKAVLTEAETGRFADAIWAQRTSPSGLPADYSFYPGIFLVLPEPSPGMAAAAFDHDVVQPLLSGDAPLVPHSFESIAYIGRTAEEGQLERSFPPEVALKLIHNMLPPTDKELDGSIAEAIFFGLLPVAILDERAAAELWTRAIANDASGAVLFLPYLARNDPSRRNEVVARLRRAMNARDFLIVDYALNAVREWVRMGDRDSVPQPLGTAVASLVAIRREPGLFRAIDVCVDLVERNFLADEDLQHVLDGLGDLLVETDYKNWRRGDFRTATLTYVRANAYRLALALRRHGRRHPSIDAWIAAGSTDPAPEVRHVVME